MDHPDWPAFVAAIVAAGLASAVRGATWSVERLS
jgi:hypothetical protein